MGTTGYIALELSESKEGELQSLTENVSKGKQLRLAALAVSWASVLFAFSSGVAAIVLGQILENQSLFGYGLDAVLDSFSSVAVLWRFYGSVTSAVAESRERKACIVISFFFFASAISLSAKSALAVIMSTKEEGDEWVLMDTFFVVCGVVAFILATSKVYIGRMLDSRSLVNDSIITYVGAAMSFLGVLGLELYRSNDRIWFLDAVFGMVGGLFLLAFGIKLLVDMTCLYRNQVAEVTSS